MNASYSWLVLAFSFSQSLDHDILLYISSVGLPTLIIPIKITPHRHSNKPVGSKRYLMKILFLDDYRLRQDDN